MSQRVDPFRVRLSALQHGAIGKPSVNSAFALPTLLLKFLCCKKTIALHNMYNNYFRDVGDKVGRVKWNRSDPKPSELALGRVNSRESERKARTG